MKNLIFVFLMSIVFCSCIETEYLPVSDSITTNCSVKLYFTQKPTQPYHELGLISMSSMYDSPTKNVKKLKEEILKRNGDAAINVTMTNNTKSSRITFSGVVIKFDK